MKSSPAPRGKVFLICYSYPPVLGGSEVEAQRVSEALIRRGYQVEVLTGPEHPMPQQRHWVDPCGIPVRILARGWPSEDWRQRIFAFEVGWILLTERKQYKLIYNLMQGMHLTTSLLAARWTGKPLVMKISGSAIIPRMQQFWLGRLNIRWLQRWAKKVMILNEGMVEEARLAGFDERQLLWMPNPVDVDDFAPAPSAERETLRQQRGLRGPTAVYIGRLAPEKELGSLVGGFAQALKQCPDAELVFVGHGPCHDELSQLAQRLGVSDRVHFPGRTDAAGVRQWLQASDVFTLVSNIEGFSCSLSEAMSVGLPSVVSDIPGNAQLIDSGVHGLRSELRNEASIAECLVCLFRDADLRQQMGAAARRRIVDNYSVEQVTDRYERLFREVVPEMHA